MLPIDGILLPETMRRALAGAAATDPVHPYRRDRPRGVRSAFFPPRLRHLLRTPATAPHSS